MGLAFQLLVMPMVILGNPLAALVVAAGFALLGWNLVLTYRRGGGMGWWLADPVAAQAWVPFLTAALWLVFGALEMTVRPGDNIRVDLLYAGPVLIPLSLGTLVVWGVIKWMLVRRLARTRRFPAGAGRDTVWR
jgi:hypothetical protein